MKYTVSVYGAAGLQGKERYMFAVTWRDRRINKWVRERNRVKDILNAKEAEVANVVTNVLYCRRDSQLEEKHQQAEMRERS